MSPWEVHHNSSIQPLEAANAGDHKISEGVGPTRCPKEEACVHATAFSVAFKGKSASDVSLS